MDIGRSTAKGLPWRHICTILQGSENPGEVAFASTLRSSGGELLTRMKWKELDNWGLALHELRSHRKVLWSLAVRQIRMGRWSSISFKEIEDPEPNVYLQATWLTAFGA